MVFDEKKAAHAVSGSTGGGAKEGFPSALYAASVTETGPDVKGGSAWARRLAGRLTPSQRRDIVRLALVIQGAEA